LAAKSLASAGVDLGLDDEVGGLERLGHFEGLVGSAGDRAGGRGNAVFLHQFLGLVLVNVHCGVSWVKLGGKPKMPAILRNEQADFSV
jgi:hypothetical protein